MAADPAVLLPLWHYECPLCEWSDTETGVPASGSTVVCALCERDCAHIVLCRTWPVAGGRGGD